MLRVQSHQLLRICYNGDRPFSCAVESHKKSSFSTQSVSTHTDKTKVAMTVRRDWEKAQGWLTGRKVSIIPTWISDWYAKWRLGVINKNHPQPQDAQEADALGDTHLELAFLCASQPFRINSRQPVVDLHFGQAEKYYLQAMADPGYAEYFVSLRASNYPSPETKLGILYTSSLSPRYNLREAVDKFRDADEAGCKHATYWLGRAYLNGTGDGNDPRRVGGLLVASPAPGETFSERESRWQVQGLNLIHEAASASPPINPPAPNTPPVLRALFEIAYLYEVGVEGLVRKNHVMAIEYYRAITLHEHARADREFISEFARTHMKDNKDFHDTDNILDSYVGSVFSWEFAAQAFLYGAVSTLSTTENGSPAVPGTCEYDSASKQGSCTLLLWIPVIGMVVAAMSIMMGIHTWFQNQTQRDKALELYMAKLDACRFLAGPKALPSLKRNLKVNAFFAFILEIAALALHSIIFFVWFTFRDGRRRD
jgi:TPR repeat protein